MKNKLIIGLFALFLNSALSAQVTFHSAEFAAGVKNHLRLTESDNVTAAQLDTIKQLDLSGLGISDIRDIRYLTHLQSVDLSYNKIEDVKPLVLMESLREVNLCHNQLESISMLAFSYAKEMEVDVAFNHITDFSIFNTLTPCQFTIDGVGLQTQEDMPYFVVRYLFSDGTEKSPSIYCRVDATTAEQAQMTVQDMAQSIATDNQPHVYQLGEGYWGTRQVMVTDGVNTDSTYLVALKKVQVKPSQNVTIKTELPENYELRYSSAQNGTLSNSGVDLLFKASSTFDYEEVIYTFYRGGELKGIAKVILTKDKVPDGIDTPTEDDTKMDIVLNGDILSVKCASTMLADESTIEVCDITGNFIVSKRVESSQGIDEQIRLPRMPKDIIIVNVTSGNKRFVDKFVLK